MNNLLDLDKCHAFTYILTGCRTVLDAYYFAEIYSRKNPEMRSLIYSRVNGKRYETILDFKTMMSLIDSVNSCQYKEDAEDIIDLYSKKTLDNTQKKTLQRISRNKPSRPYMTKTIVDQNKIDKITITKNCPHCNHSNTCDVNSCYVICGYVNQRSGYDWKGCGKDWCFKCRKMLCKSWKENQLDVLYNRYHNNECCKSHAKEHNKNYIEEYCQCNTSNVNRENLIIEM